MAKKQAEPIVILEREYIIPLRREWLKVPQYKRANKAVKAIKEFLVRHMKVYDRDLRKIKIDILLNNELRFRGMRKPPAKIKVKAKKFDNGIVRVELAEIPEHIKFLKLREEKKLLELEKKAKVEEKKEEKAEEKKKPEELEKKLEEEKKAEEKEEKPEEVKEKEEKKEATVEAGLKEAKQEARKQKHLATSKKQPKIHRMALQK